MRYRKAVLKNKNNFLQLRKLYTEIVFNKYLSFSFETSKDIKYIKMFVLLGLLISTQHEPNSYLRIVAFTILKF